MQIGSTTASCPAYSALAASRLGRGAPAATGSAAAAPVADRGGGIGTYDFSRMTPREMLATVNSLIQSGRMSILESAGLITLAPAPIDGGSPESLPSFDQPMDYLTKAKNIIGAYKSTGNQHNAEHWSRLLDKLQSLQGTPSGVNELV